MSHISKRQSGKINSFQGETGRYNSMHDCFVFSRTSYYLQFAIFSEKSILKLAFGLILKASCPKSKLRK